MALYGLYNAFRVDDLSEKKVTHHVFARKVKFLHEKSRFPPEITCFPHFFTFPKHAFLNAFLHQQNRIRVKPRLLPPILIHNRLQNNSMLQKRWRRHFQRAHRPNHFRLRCHLHRVLRRFVHNKIRQDRARTNRKDHLYVPRNKQRSTKFDDSTVRSTTCEGLRCPRHRVGIVCNVA